MEHRFPKTKESGDPQHVFWGSPIPSVSKVDEVLRRKEFLVGSLSVMMFSFSFKRVSQLGVCCTR